MKPWREGARFKEADGDLAPTGTFRSLGIAPASMDIFPVLVPSQSVK